MNISCGKRALQYALAISDHSCLAFKPDSKITSVIDTDGFIVYCMSIDCSLSGTKSYIYV